MRGGAAAADDGAVRPLYDQGGIVVAVIVPGRHLQLRKELREQPPPGSRRPED